jgi:uncharacterized delta-60 repeat protein
MRSPRSRRLPTVLLVAAAFGGLPAFAGASPGDLDPSFGTGGVVATSGFSGQALAVQPDGKILIAGVTSDSRFAVSRYTSDGSIDPGFGAGGVVAISFGTPVQAAYDLALQPDGRIVAVGTAGIDFGRDRSFALARFNADGSLDSSFGVGGRVTTGVGGAIGDANAVALQGDGRIVAAGFGHDAPGGEFALARYNRDGSLDGGFGSAGVVRTDFGLAEIATDIAVGREERIVAGGFVSTATGDDSALARYLADGALDPGFGLGGRVSTDLGGSDGVYSLELVAGGRILTVGPLSRGTNSIDFALARYTRDGRLDRTFGDGGLVTTNFGIGVQIPYALATSGGTTVVAGLAFNAVSPASGDDIALARYGRSGELDRRFGVDGRVVTDLIGVNNSARDVAIQGHGIVVVANGALLRYLG